MNTSFSTDYTALGIKSVDDNNVGPYLNSDHAGTPENFKTSLTAGGLGGGGSNVTGAMTPLTGVSPTDCS